MPIKIIKSNTGKVVFFGSLMLLLVLGGLFFLKSNNKVTVLESLIVNEGDVDLTLSLSGRVVPAESVKVGFAESGIISSINFSEGESVKKGEVIASLNNRILTSELREAEAEVSTQESILQELKSGSRPEIITEKQIQLDLATSQLSFSLQTLLTKVKNLRLDSENAVKNVIDDFMVGGQSPDPRLRFPLPQNQSLKLALEFERKRVETLLNEWPNYTSTDFNLNNFKSVTEEVLNKSYVIRDFINLASDVVNIATPSDSADELTLRTWKNNLANEKNNNLTNIQETQSALQAVNESNLAVARANTDLKQAVNGPTTSEINTQDSRINQAKARLETIKARIDQRRIVSPINGVIAKLNFKAGETISPQETLATIVNPDSYEIELEVPELNINNIKIGDPAIINLAALGNESLAGVVTEIKPTAQTDSNLVPFYDVRVRFEDQVKVKDGLIADVTLITDSVTNSVTIPTRFIFKDTNNQDTVTTELPDGTFENKNITVKTRLSNGLSVIESGLQIGEKVVIIKENL